jgi:outer membrane protein assembly factor BamB
LVVFLCVCLAIGVGVQFATPINDNSVRNVISIIVALVAAIGFSIWVYRALATAAPRPVALILTLLMMASPAAFLKLRGFSGEMIPQIESRFASNRELPTPPSSLEAAADDAHVVSTDFPQFLGPRRDAVVDGREFDLPNPADFATPLWRQPIGDGWAGFAIANDRCVTLEQRDGQECVTCYRLGDGQPVWIHTEDVRHENPLGGIGPRSTPTIFAQRVYTQGATGIVNCLDLVTGDPIWRQDLLELAGWDQAASEAEISWGRAGSPLLTDEGLCVVPLGGPSGGASGGAPVTGRGLVAFDAQTGEIRWTAGNDQISYASPMMVTLGGVRQIMIVNENSVTGHSPDDGEVLWSTPWNGQSNGAANCASALPVGDDAFWVGKAYGTGSGVFELSRDDAGLTVSERWKRPSVLKTKFTNPCIVDGFAYALSDGTLECVDLAEGKRMWAQPRGSRYGHGQLILVEDVLVVQTEAGNVAMVAARTDRFDELVNLPALDSKTWNVPAIAGRYLAIRNDIEAIVYQLPERSQPTPPPADADGENTGDEDAGDAASDQDVTSVSRPSA